jgi:hypothetical protein
LQEGGDETKFGFWDVLMVSLVTGGVELNPGPPVNQRKIDQILAHVQNQDESKGIKSLLQTHNQEIKETEDVTQKNKFEKLIEMIKQKAN